MVSAEVLKAIRAKAEVLAGHDLGEQGDLLVEMAAHRACSICQREDIPEAMGKLRVIYPNIMELRYDNTRTRTSQSVSGAENVQQKTPLQLFEELYEAQNNQPMSQEQRGFVTELIESIWEGRQ